MQFTVPCEIYAKFAQLALTAVDKDWQVVRLEYKNGRKCAIASDRKNIVVYNLGEVGNDPDGAINIVADAKLIAAASNEVAYKSNLEIVAIPGVGASAKTTFGYIHPGNAVNFDDRTKLADWRSIYEPVKKTRGAMFWNVAGIGALAAASISGSIRFPEFIDAGKPVVVRDVVDPNWFGLFLPTRVVDGQSTEVEPAQLPEWAVK